MSDTDKDKSSRPRAFADDLTIDRYRGVSDALQNSTHERAPWLLSVVSTNMFCPQIIPLISLLPAAD